MKNYDILHINRHKVLNIGHGAVLIFGVGTEQGKDTFGRLSAPELNSNANINPLNSRTYPKIKFSQF